MSPTTTHLPGKRLQKYCAVVMVVLVFLIAGGSSRAIDIGSIFTAKFNTINLAIRSGEWDSYVTGYAWHLPYAYSNSTRSRLNNTTWGGGFGRELIDADGDRHSVYVMAFSDSHRVAQYNVGYGWQRYWSPGAGLNVGLGYMAFLFSREDVAHHLPLPGILPCVSIRYNRFEFVGQFIPHISEDIKGDVLFVFLRVPLGDDNVRTKRRGF